MVSEDQGPTVSPRWRRVLWATFPIGIALLIAWAIRLAFEIAVDDTPSGLSIASSILGLLTSLTLIVSGLSYRRALRRQ